MSGFISDRLYVNTEILTSSSAKGANQYSQRYDLSNCSKISFIATPGTAQSGIAALPNITFYKSSALTGAGTAISSATCDFKNSTALIVTKANAVLITIDTAADWSADPVVILNGSSLHGSTLITGTTWAGTSYAVGASTLDSSSAANAMANLINNSTLFPNLWAIATANAANAGQVKVMVRDGASTYITTETSAASIIVSMSAQQKAVFDFDVDMLGSDRYIWAKISTQATGVSLALTCIKDGKGHYPTHTTCDYLVQYKSS